MPIFTVHMKENAFTSAEKNGLADALALALHEAMGSPMEDQFTFFHEHKEDNFYVTRTFPNMKRTDKRILVNVTFNVSRTLEQKKKLAELITRYAMEKAGVGFDDVAIMMYALPLENMSFGRGEVITDETWRWTLSLQ